MIVSWNWLKEYVSLDATADEFARRLMMAGLNHESTETVGDDLAIDLEVTSNRPDCLGHIGIAREAAVLWQRDLKIPAAAPAEGKTPAGELVGVSIECPDLCSRYIARVVRGVRVGPSPAWMQKRLATLGIAAINNIVDIPELRPHGVRPAAAHVRLREAPRAGDHRPPSAAGRDDRSDRPQDLRAGGGHVRHRRRPRARGHRRRDGRGGHGSLARDHGGARGIGGVRSDSSIRTTARRLGLHSDSSHRFERRVDPEGIDWASRRVAS